MSDIPPQKEENLADEIRALGQNLVQVFRSVWDHPERQRLQRELESGLSDLSQTMNREFENLKESPTGQRLRADVEDLSERVRTGEAEAKVRAELLNVLRTVNQELQKVAHPRTSSSEQAPAEAAGSESEEPDSE